MCTAVVEYVTPEFVGISRRKIEAEETPEKALAREIREELDCTIEVYELIEDIVHYYPNITVNLLTYKAKIINGEPRAKEHAKLEWTSIKKLKTHEWAPADIPTIDKLLKNE